MDAGAIHFLAGAAGGTAGAVVTCPLEVVKTRLQSSTAKFTHLPASAHVARLAYGSPAPVVGTAAEYVRTDCSSVEGRLRLSRRSGGPSIGLYQNLKHIVQTEGSKALFKGLGPNLIGVAPSRAIYFWAYSQSKRCLNNSGFFQPDTPIVHIFAAASAGFSSSTFTNPIWFIKTRLQLDQHGSTGRLTAFQCARQIYSQHGIAGFYKGITASYYGLSETVLHFVVYEEMKIILRDATQGDLEDDDDRSAWQFLEYMAAGATSKTLATCVAYPHEVARTRLREEGSRYKTFWQTLRLVYTEEGVRGIYRGLATQLVRQIPNTAVMMATYEAVVYLYKQSLTPQATTTV